MRNYFTARTLAFRNTPNFCWISAAAADERCFSGSVPIFWISPTQKRRLPSLFTTRFVERIGETHLVYQRKAIEVMKKQLVLTTCALAMAAFVGCRDRSSDTVNEPAGSSRSSSSSSTNSLDMSRTNSSYQGGSSSGSSSGSSVNEPSGSQSPNSSGSSGSSGSSSGTSGSGTSGSGTSGGSSGTSGSGTGSSSSGSSSTPQSNP